MLGRSRNSQTFIFMALIYLGAIVALAAGGQLSAQSPVAKMAPALLTGGAVATSMVEVSLEKATILQLQKAMEQGTLTAEALVRMQLQRIAAYDQKGPSINAILTLNQNALEVARALDHERKVSGPRGPLHGISIVPKDNYDTHDLPTTGGFRGLDGSIPAHDAYTIRRLREAGAIILAKTNLDEFNSGSSGTSGLGGQVLNPYNLNKTPGGSSGGSGAGVAAGFAQVGLGTETGSSIRNPAAKTALVGIAPTIGLVSRHGVVPSSIVLDRTGPLARSVTDAAIVLHAMAGMDAGDLMTVASIGKVPPKGYLEYLDAEALKYSRIGVLRENFGSDPEDEEGLELIESALKTMAEAGAVLVDPVKLNLDMFQVLRSISSGGGERREALAHYLRSRGPNTPVKNIEDILASGVLLGKLEEGFKRALEQPPLYDNPTYASFIRNREAFQKAILSLMELHDLDAIVYPYQTKPEYTIAEAAPEAGAVRGAPNYNVLGRGTRISTVTGFPGIVVPTGFMESDGMPVALEILGRPWDEGKLIGLAYGIEQQLDAYRLPESTPPLDGHFIRYSE